MKSYDYAAKVKKLHPTQSDIWKKDKVKTWSQKYYPLWCGTEKDVKPFYKAGKHSFLQGRSGTIEYAGETVYLHTLHFHTPRLMQKIWKQHGLPIGCFTMQGFERRNQESKRIF